MKTCSVLNWAPRYEDMGEWRYGPTHY